MIAATLLFLTLRQAKITIPLAPYGLAELAKRLSTPDLVVTTKTDLDNRGALVSLHDRPQQEALEIVCKALDLEVVTTRPGHIRLEPSPTVQKRERTWRIGLIRLLQSVWTRQMNDLADLADLDKQEIKARIDKLQAGPKPIDGEKWTDLQILWQAGPAAAPAVKLANSAAADLNGDFLTARIQRDQPTITISPAEVAGLQKAMHEKDPLRNPVMLQRIFNRGIGALTITSGIFATDKEGLWISVPTPGSRLVIGQGKPNDPARILFTSLVHPAISKNGLGPDASEWLAQSRRTTEAELKRPGMETGIEYTAYEASLSGLVEAWSKKNGQDVVMEMAPMAESLDFGPMLVTSATKLSRTIHDALRLDDQWGLDSVAGVLVVRNRMAFLDHVSLCPVGAIADYARNSEGRCGVLQYAQTDAKLPLIDALLPLVRLRNDPAMSMTTWFDYPGYKGLADPYLMGVSGLLWPAVPDDIKARFEVEKQGEASVPLNQLAGDSLDQLVTAKLGPEFLPKFRESLLRELSHASLAIKWKRVDADEVNVDFDIDGIQDEGMQQNLAIAFAVRSKARGG